MNIAIGAAQFGNAYGISNRIGKPSIAEAARIICRAKHHGIDTIDTAIAYKNSNAVLAEVGVGGFKVCTKISLRDICDPSDVNLIYDKVAQSRQLLNIPSFDSLLWHNTDELLKQKSGALIDVLEKLKRDGVIKKIGYSLYGHDSLNALFDILRPEIIQVPLNVFDQRILTSGFMNSPLSEGLEIHARSLFLQGLLLFKKKDRPIYFDRWKSLFSRWDSFVGDSSPLAICLSFARQHSRFNRFVVGVNTADELEGIMESLGKIKLHDLSAMASVDPELIEPFRWKL